jgi:hypothetical protein
MLSDDAQRRLIHYCRRAATSPPEYISQDYGCHQRNVRYVDRHLRELVWNDTEVREALLHAGFDAVLAQMPAGQALSLLDLCTAMALEAARRAARHLTTA